jgi:FixJ family two-component response regulator
MRERTVFVVDDDESVAASLGALFRSAGLRTETFDSATLFLRRAILRRPCCLVVEAGVAGLSGLALQEALAGRGVRIPILFIAREADVATAVAAVKKGAHDFLEKPLDEARLLGEVLALLDDDTAAGRAVARPQRQRLDKLSDREREVLDWVLEGKSSREIGEALYISVKTVEFHRARIMQKLGVRSAAELFRACLAQ